MADLIEKARSGKTAWLAAVPTNADRAEAGRSELLRWAVPVRSIFGELRLENGLDAELLATAPSDGQAKTLAADIDKALADARRSPTLWWGFLLKNTSAKDSKKTVTVKVGLTRDEVFAWSPISPDVTGA